MEIMLKDKMIMDQDQIKKMLDDNEAKYKLDIAKALSRIEMFRDGENKINDNWLKPYCFDKLKEFVKQKKNAFQQIRKLDKFVSKHGDIANAFEQWRTSSQKGYSALMGKTQQELFDRSATNQK